MTCRFKTAHSTQHKRRNRRTQPTYAPCCLKSSLPSWQQCESSHTGLAAVKPSSTATPLPLERKNPSKPSVWIQCFPIQPNDISIGFAWILLASGVVPKLPYMHVVAAPTMPSFSKFLEPFTLSISCLPLFVGRFKLFHHVYIFQRSPLTDTPSINWNLCIRPLPASVAPANEVLPNFVATHPHVVRCQGRIVANQRRRSQRGCGGGGGGGRGKPQGKG